jgi:hypothetical protein
LLDSPAPLDLPDPILQPPATRPASPTQTEQKSPEIIPLEPLDELPRIDSWPDRPPLLDREQQHEEVPMRRTLRQLVPDPDRDSLTQDNPPTLDRAERNRLRDFAEQSIRSTLGRQIRSLDVDVDSEGRIDVRLRTRWPWQRRGARRAIENLPFAQKHELRVLSD